MPAPLTGPTRRRSAAGVLAALSCAAVLTLSACDTSSESGGGSGGGSGHEGGHPTAAQRDPPHVPAPHDDGADPAVGVQPEELPLRPGLLTVSGTARPDRVGRRPVRPAGVLPDPAPPRSYRRRCDEHGGQGTARRRHRDGGDVGASRGHGTAAARHPAAPGRAHLGPRALPGRGHRDVGEDHRAHRPPSRDLRRDRRRVRDARAPQRPARRRGRVPDRCAPARAQRGLVRGVLQRLPRRVLAALVDPRRDHPAAAPARPRTGRRLPLDGARRGRARDRGGRRRRGLRG